MLLKFLHIACHAVRRTSKATPDAKGIGFPTQDMI